MITIPLVLRLRDRLSEKSFRNRRPRGTNVHYTQGAYGMLSNPVLIKNDRNRTVVDVL